MRHQAMLQSVGRRVRRLREEMRLSRRELSEKSGVSQRFLAQLEAGEGNISLLRLADVCEALGSSPEQILAGTSSQRASRFIALLGLRGAGKSTVGLALAEQRGVEFVEVDGLIEKSAGLSLGEIFELHGEAYYRRLEREALEALLQSPEPAIIATGGSIVTHTENFSLLQNSACTLWLKANPQDHWNRVIEQGDERPMAENPQAFSELKDLLATREKLYAQSNFTLETSNKTISDVVSEANEVLRQD